MGELIKKFNISSQTVIPVTKEIQLVRKVWKPLINFVPRPELMKKICNFFSEDINHIFIFGIGGSGKSELIRKYVSMVEEKYKNVCMLRYYGSIRETINKGLFFCTKYLTSQEIEQQMKKMTRQEVFLEKVRMLNEIEKCLLVIDNVENIEDENMQLILESNAHVIIITREYINYANALNITDTMLEEEEIQLFKNTCLIHDLDEKIIRKLCKICNRHPMTIILLATLVSMNKYELPNIFKKFRMNQKSVFSDAILLEKDRIFKDMQIKKHIETIIDLYGLSKQQKQILINISFAHPLFLWQEDFFLNQSKEIQSDVKILQKLNLIHIESRRIHIHPLLAESIMEMLRPSIDKCRPILNHFSEIFDGGQTDDYYLSTIANNMAVYFDDYDDKYQKMLLRGAKYWFHQSEYEIAINIYEYILRFVTDEYDYVQAKYQVALNLKYIGKYQDSINVYLEVQKKCAKYPGSRCFKKAQILALIGIANNYHMLGEAAENNIIRVGYFVSSIDFYKKALHISKTIDGAKSKRCASIYDNMALMYANVKQFKHAFSNSRLARILFRELEGEVSFEMAKCYINLGEIYRLSGKQKEALMAFKIAEQVKLKVLPENHDSHIVTFINIGDILILMKRYDEAEEYFIKAQNIASLKLSHAHIYNSYISRGLTTISAMRM